MASYVLVPGLSSKHPTHNEPNDKEGNTCPAVRGYTMFIYVSTKGKWVKTNFTQLLSVPSI